MIDLMFWALFVWLIMGSIFWGQQFIRNIHQPGLGDFFIALPLCLIFGPLYMIYDFLK
jgi:hypothetical protein